MKYTKLLFLLLLPLFLFSQQTEKRIALVIGNAEYTKGALKNPVNDAKLIAKTLDSLGFEILEYSRNGFVQGYIPFFGRYLKPNGLILNFFGSFLGWYHCIICKPNK